MNHWTRGVCITVLILATSACRIPQIGAKSVDELPDYAEPTKTICAGRLLVNVPANAQTVLETKFRGVSLSQREPINSFTSIEKRLRQRAEELRSIPMNVSLSGRNFFESAGYNPDQIFGKTRLLGFEADEDAEQAIIGYHTTNTTSEFVVELHKAISGWDYTFDVQSLHANRYSGVRDNLVEVAAKFAPRSNDVPNKPRFCIDGGFYSDLGDYSPLDETFMLSIKFPKHPETVFQIMSFNVSPDGPSGQTLQERAEEDYAQGRSLGINIDVFASGERRVASQDGYEQNDAVSFEDDGRTNHAISFRWESDGKYDDPTRPKLIVTMDIGPLPEDQTAFDSIEDMRVLWNLMLKSLRIQPASR